MESGAIGASAATAVSTTKPSFRWMLRADLDDVLHIERQCFDHPWDREEFTRCLRQRHCIGKVLEIEGRIAAYCVYVLHASRMELLSIAVHPDFQRQGVGLQFLRKLQSQLRFAMSGTRRRRNRLVAEVRERNLAAQLFFKRAGFRAIAVLPDWYDEAPGEDAYLFEWQMPLDDRL